MIPDGTDCVDEDKQSLWKFTRACLTASLSLSETFLTKIKEDGDFCWFSEGSSSNVSNG